MPNVNYDALLTTTLANHQNKLVDNVFSARPLLYFVKQAGQIKNASGGTKAVFPLMYGKNSTVKSYGTGDTLDNTPQDGISAAEFTWKRTAVSVSIEGIDEAMNSGEEEVIDLLETKVTQAEESLSEWMDDKFINGDGTGNSGKDPHGLASLVLGHTNTTAVGNINPTSDAWWASKRESTAEPLSIGRMTSMYNSISVGNDQPNFGLTNQTLYEKYESLLQPQLRFADSGTADAGFQNLLFKGMPISFDEYVGTGLFYFLNTRYLGIKTLANKWFKPTPFVRPEDKDFRVAQILSYFAFGVSNRKRQGVLSAKTA